jgi:hypothetical protein
MSRRVKLLFMDTSLRDQRVTGYSPEGTISANCNEPLPGSTTPD